MMDLNELNSRIGAEIERLGEAALKIELERDALLRLIRAFLDVWNTYTDAPAPYLKGRELNVLIERMRAAASGKNA